MRSYSGLCGHNLPANDPFYERQSPQLQRGSFGQCRQHRRCHGQRHRPHVQKGFSRELLRISGRVQEGRGQDGTHVRVRAGRYGSTQMDHQLPDQEALAKSLAARVDSGGTPGSAPSHRRARDSLSGSIGCGLGGFVWDNVCCEIEQAFAGVEDVEVIIYEPMATYRKAPNGTESRNQRSR